MRGREYGFGGEEWGSFLVRRYSMINLVLGMWFIAQELCVDLIGVSYLSRGHRGLPGRWSGMPALRVNNRLWTNVNVANIQAF